MKIRKSEKSGAGSDDLYVSSLWYFDKLDFLRDQELQLEGVATFDESFMEQEPRAKKAKFDPAIFLQKASDHLEKSATTPERDEAAVFGEGWASVFRKLTPEQQIFSKRIIDDALVQGQLRTLTIDSYIETRRHHYRPNYVQRQHSNSNSPYFYQTPSPLSPVADQSSSHSAQQTIFIPVSQHSSSCSTPKPESQIQILSQEIIRPNYHTIQELFC